MFFLKFPNEMLDKLCQLPKQHRKLCQAGKGITSKFQNEVRIKLIFQDLCKVKVLNNSVVI